jgi:hypothetical protein
MLHAESIGHKDLIQVERCLCFHCVLCGTYTLIFTAVQDSVLPHIRFNC